MYTCGMCGKPTPNYREYLPSFAAFLGEQGYSRCDECRRKVRIAQEWKNEQEAEERMICPYCESDLSMRGAGSLREDSTLCLLWAMLMDSYTRWRTTGGVFVEASD